MTVHLDSIERRRRHNPESVCADTAPRSCSRGSNPATTALTTNSGTSSRPGPPQTATIGIPTFNRAKLLSRAIASALQQDHEPLEVLVVDNCSTDGTEELVAEVEAFDPRVRLLRQPRNLGPAVNFETALLEARGDFFMWLADDDWITPGYLRACLHTLITESHVVVVGRDVWHQPRAQVQEPEVVVVDRTPYARILNYLRHVDSNAAFYGVARTADLRPLLPLPRGLAGDWWWMVDLACRGSISVSRDAELHRSVGGLSSDPQALAEHFGLGWFPRHLPHTTIALGAARHLASSDHLSSVGGRRRRVVLALRGGLIVGMRLGVIIELLSPLRRCMQCLLPPNVYARVRLLYQAFTGTKRRHETTPGPAHEADTRSIG
jgi:Glycosyl transferase family 2